MCSIIIVEGKKILMTPMDVAEYFQIPQMVILCDNEDGSDFDDNGCLCQVDVEATLIQNRILFTYDDELEEYEVPENVASNIYHSLN